MEKRTNSESGIFNARILVAFGLCSVAVWLAAASLTMPGRAAAQSSSGVRIYVTTLKQKIGGIGTGGCSLQEAIYSSELNSSFFANYYGGHGIAIDATDPDHFIATDCVAGTGNGDTIVLPSGGTFNLTTYVDADAYNPYGPTATPIIFSTMTIEGNGATLQWTGGTSKNVRLFAVGPATITVTNSNGNPVATLSGTGNLTVKDVYVKGFHAKGGDGAVGGGGGLGAGGAIYLQNGSLDVENSTFDTNGAVGGNGGSVWRSGGGGGLGGNGGRGTHGGGGGGSTGNGGNDGVDFYLPGGGGGGTVFPGANGNVSTGVGGPGGYLCGGSGGDSGGGDGHDANCPGGGGGGAGAGNNTSPKGGSGNYGGGGGGGDQGGAGGFAGGGGAGLSGGAGGFGGGGGSPNGNGGFAGGKGSNSGGGGGGALGGAIFNDSGAVVVQNSTFFNNYVTRGTGVNNGGDGGGAIFARNGRVTIIDSTFSGNQSTGSGGAVVVHEDGSSTSFALDNTIIANNGANECYFTGSVTTTGAGNLITSNGSGSLGACPGVVTTTDPQLGSLQLNPPGNTPTMAIPLYSSAMGMADPGTSLAADQRGADRPEADVSPGNGYDIGAYEVCRKFFGHMLNAAPCPESNSPPPQTTTLTMQVSPTGWGTTNPPIGNNTVNLNSVQPIQATPSSGYAFWNWTGPVADPTNPSTTVTMTQAQTVTANFRVISAVSHKTHGNAGSFNIPLPLSGTSGIECRSGGSTGDHQLLVTFANPVAVNGNPQARVTTGAGQIGSGGTSNGGVVTLNPNKTVVTIPLTNVTNAQRMVVTLFGVNDGTSATNVQIPMGVLLGDVNGNGVVSNTDVSLVKGQVTATVGPGNFREDVNANGVISNTDVSLTKAQVGATLP